MTLLSKSGPLKDYALSLLFYNNHQLHFCCCCCFYLVGLLSVNNKNLWSWLRFIHSFILETYIEPLRETTTQRRSQPSHEQKRRTSERCKILKGGSSARNAAQRRDHSMLMDAQPKKPSAA